MLRAAAQPVRAIVDSGIAAPLFGKTLPGERITFKCKKNFNCFPVTIQPQAFKTVKLVDIPDRQIHDFLAQT